VALQQFDEQLAAIPDEIADRIESKKSEHGVSLGNAFELLDRTTFASLSEKPKDTLALSLPHCGR
jgi:hypothetical protein